MARIAWLPETIVQLDAIRLYIEQFDPDAAARLTQRLREAGESLATFPNRGRPAGRYRELVTVPPYIIRYRVADGAVYITRLRHGRQAPDNGG